MGFISMLTLMNPSYHLVGTDGERHTVNYDPDQRIYRESDKVAFSSLRHFTTTYVLRPHTISEVVFIVDAKSKRMRFLSETSSSPAGKKAKKNYTCLKLKKMV